MSKLTLKFVVDWKCPNCEADLPMPLKKKYIKKENIIKGHTICLECGRVVAFAAQPEIAMEHFQPKPPSSPPVCQDCGKVGDACQCGMGATGRIQ